MPYRWINSAEQSGVTIVRFSETKITDSARIEELRHELTRLVDTEQPYKVLLNFEKVDYLSSEALRAFLLLHKKLQGRGATLKLCNVMPAIFQVFELTGLNKVFDIQPTQVDALNQFQGKA